MLEWLCRELGLAGDPAELGLLAASADDAAGARVLPALAGLGAPWWRAESRAVLPGCTAATPSARPRRPGGHRLAVADVVEAVQRSTPGRPAARRRRADQRAVLLLALQADAIGAPVEAIHADATVSAPRRWPPSAPAWQTASEDTAALLGEARHVEPRRDDAWRTAEHERWRAFVRAAADVAPATAPTTLG